MAGLDDVANAVAPGGTLLRDPVKHYSDLAHARFLKIEELERLIMDGPSLAIKMAFEQHQRADALQQDVDELNEIVAEFKEKFGRFGKTYGGQV